nr:type II toxin-antitoxin system YoeB family toxin [Pseudanabaena yagii]
MKRRILFEAVAFEDFNEWAKSDRKIYNKIAERIKDIERIHTY